MKRIFQVVNEMQAAGIIGKYAIGGAVGATFYLEPAATVDVNLFISLPARPTKSLISLTPIYEFLQTRGGRLDREYVVLDGWPVQFLPTSDALDEEAVGQSVSTEVDGVRTWVITAEHLAAIALRTGRAKDHNRVLQFLEQNALDQQKFLGILQRHGLVAKWDRFERKYLHEDKA